MSSASRESVLWTALTSRTVIGALLTAFLHVVAPRSDPSF